MTTPADPKQILAQAAEAARAAAEILPVLEQDLDDMQEAVRVKKLEIDEVRALAERHKPTSNVVLKSGPPKLITLRHITPTAATGGAAFRSVIPDMERALTEAGPISVPDMASWIKEKLGRDWAQSTMYNQLKRGKDAGKYVNEDNKWSMSATNQAEFSDMA